MFQLHERRFPASHRRQLETEFDQLCLLAPIWNRSAVFPKISRIYVPIGPSQSTGVIKSSILTESGAVPVHDSARGPERVRDVETPAGRFDRASICNGPFAIQPGS